VRRFSQTVITSRWLVMIPLVDRTALEGVGGGSRVAGQAAAQRGAEGVREHAEHDVEVDVERDGAGQSVEAEGADGLGKALLDVHPPGRGPPTAARRGPR
jgi:hypothetical protein